MLELIGIEADYETIKPMWNTAASILARDSPEVRDKLIDDR